ncbi:MAG: hypothetical protein NDI90_05800 [Nitrospira sp. BO4]|nr:hypothetical protein [Nitrospira sp. BO4]
MTDYWESIHDHLAAIKKRLDNGGLTDSAAEALEKKIRCLAVLLSEKRGNSGSR